MSKEAPDSNRLPGTAEEWWVLLAAEAPPEPSLAEAFQRWKSEPGNAEAYEEVARMWADMDAGRGDRQLREWLEEAGAPVRRQRAGLRRWVAAAATLAVLLAAVPVVLWMVPDPVQEPALAAWQPVATMRGEVREIALVDGSILHLDTGTRAEVDLQGPAQRRIRLLEGRVRIDVGHAAPAAARVDQQELQVVEYRLHPRPHLLLNVAREIT